MGVRREYGEGGDVRRLRWLFKSMSCHPSTGWNSLLHTGIEKASVATMSNEDENDQVFKGTTTEDVRLENLGYEQGKLPLRKRYPRHPDNILTAL